MEAKVFFKERIVAPLLALRKRLARYFVRLWAIYNFNKAMRKADERYEREHTMIYVCQQPFNQNVLTTYNRRRFKLEKKAWGWHGILLTLQSMKYGCYYHTPDRAGNQAMTEDDIKMRRNYFIGERLHEAKLD